MESLDVEVDKAEKPTLSEQEIHVYVAAEAALTTTKPWELVITSKRMHLYAILAAAIIIALHTFLALIVAVGDTGAAVTRIDQWGYFLVGVIFAVAAYVALSRPRLRVNEDGVDVRNFLGSHFYPWAVIYGLNFPEGAMWPRLELPEFEYTPVWAINAGDGAASVAAIEAFRKLEAKYLPEE